MENINAPSKAEKRIGWTLTVIVILFLLMDGVTKLIGFTPSVEETIKLGYQENTVPVIGFILLVCTMLYLYPPTSILGAVLLTGYLGGAIAAHLRAGNPLFSHTLFPLYFGLLAWAGLYLRDHKLRFIFPIRIRKRQNIGLNQPITE
jgi:hypothetical protein